MTSTTWNPDQYERYRAERGRPFHDLLALVRPRKGMRAIDLGCGTGALTRHLHEHTGASDTLGVDSSAAMLERAAPHAGDGLRFERAEIESLELEGDRDLVFSNAALHWCEDHGALFARLAGALPPGGQLAVQVPANDDQPSHRVMAEVAAEEPHRTDLGGFVRRSPVLPPEDYSRLMHELGFAEHRVHLAVYGHLLEGPEGVVEWVRGTTLTDYERRMAPDAFERFVDAYRARLLAELGDARPYYFPFKRVLIWGVLPPATAG